ncbi:FadR/GntR family transcriptional regulator [Viridibacillus sp. FSL R5-0477]|uniref:GntR family transcriptional regulator n=1 Tax=Viridibacillus arenosi FSL R5-213 TaxID=1227360 RepID=W4F0X3_9BACL|nr:MULTISPECIES: FadR/GntR family transcriptional regulator [Viridibacillus]ETT86478.1 GntR family transcriptional regulator [Viridibacillus arenosi FSL R5-213]OMC84642.1 GntR family transcriptional regulator [Viridibacillus sp. FSL H8-0123]OMC91690.1 GntR family transcriptional regulator [Viridibacillus arenosi]
MNYKKITRKKIYEEVADILLEMIKDGQLKPGDQLDSVQELAVNFQVGRSAIREALTSLRAMGLIEMRQGEGTFVKTFTADNLAYPIQSAILMTDKNIQELLEVRQILETGIVASAAQKRTAEDLEVMRVHLMEMINHKKNSDLGERADLAFHLAIAKAANNVLLSTLMQHVSHLMSESMRETRRICLYDEKKTLDLLNEQHHLIYKQIEAQDAEGAAKAMKAHLQFVESVLAQYIQEEND